MTARNNTLTQSATAPTDAPYECTSQELRLLQAFRDLPRRERNAFYGEITYRATLWRICELPPLRPRMAQGSSA